MILNRFFVLITSAIFFVCQVNAIPIFDDINYKLRDQLVSEIESFAHLQGKNITYEQWESPQGDDYIIPFLDGKAVNGFKLINAHTVDKNTISKAFAETIETEKINYYLQEEEIEAFGFPNLWKKLFPEEDDCEEEPESTEQNFPFGAKKFLLVGVKEESISPTDSKMYSETKEVIPVVDNKGFLFKKKKEEDDCDDEEEKNGKLFNTDKFLFIGIGSVNKTEVELNELALQALEFTDTSSSASSLTSSMSIAKPKKALASPATTVASKSKAALKLSLATVKANSNFHPGTIMTHGPYTTKSTKSKTSTGSSTTLTTDVPHPTTLRQVATGYTHTAASDSGNNFYQKSFANGSSLLNYVNGSSYTNQGYAHSSGQRTQLSVLAALVLVGFAVIIL